MSSLPESLGHSIKTLQHRHHRAMDARLAPIGLSLVQWNALREIDRNPGATQHRLAELTFNSDQAFGTLSARMLGLGLAERRHGPGRALNHVLTERGDALHRQGRALVEGVLTASFGPLDEGERATLLRLLTKALDGGAAARTSGRAASQAPQSSDRPGRRRRPPPQGSLDRP